MSRARSWTRVLGILVLVGALAAVFAGPASAYTHKQKRHIRRVLLHQLKKHPRLIKNKHWLRKADHVQETLPLTIRLNPIVDPLGDAAASDDVATLDLTDTFGPEVGKKQTTLSGTLNVDAHFGNPQNGDPLGSLRLVVKQANLSAASVGVLENPDVTCPTGPAWTYTSGGTVGAPSGAPSLAPSVDGHTVVRTAPIALSLADTAAPNVGTANLFGTGPTNLALSLHVNAAINTIFRIADDGSGGSENGSGLPTDVWSQNAAVTLPSQLLNCEEAIAAQTVGSGTTGNVIPVDVTGKLNINPALTTDGRLRIATVSASTPTDSSGVEVGHSTVSACLEPASLIHDSNTDTNVSSLISTVNTAFPGTIPTTTPSPLPPGNTSDFVQTSNAPSAPCSDSTAPAFNALEFPLALLGLQPATSAAAQQLDLDPNVSVNHLTAEALIG